MIGIYPGLSMTSKRCKHCIILSSIALTLFMNDVQDVLMDKTLELMEDTATYIPLAQSQADIILTLLPVLEKLEDSKLGYLIQDVGLPNTIEIRRNCEAVQNVGQSIPRIFPLLKLTAQILKFTSILLFIQIMISLYWMCMDVKKGKQKLLTIGLLVLAIFINYRVHLVLTEMNLFT